MRDPAVRRVSASWYRAARCSLRLTREELAWAIGCSVRALADWESGKVSAPHDARVVIELMLVRAA